MKDFNNLEIDGLVIIEKRNQLITKIFEKYFLYLQSLSAINNRVDKKEDDLQDFFMLLCKKNNKQLEELLNNNIRYIRKAYINAMISKIRKEGKDISLPIINEIVREERAIEDIYNFITEEDIRSYRKIIKNDFRKPDKYIQIFDMMIREYSNKEIIKATGLPSSTIATIKRRIGDLLKSKIIGG